MADPGGRKPTRGVKPIRGFMWPELAVLARQRREDPPREESELLEAELQGEVGNLEDVEEQY